MKYYVYMMTNWDNGVLYIGMTNDIGRRVQEHQKGMVEGFTKKYNTTKLVYVEMFDYVIEAIGREKTLKGWLRIKKNELVETINPDWQDLSQTWL